MKSRAKLGDVGFYLVVGDLEEDDPHRHQLNKRDLHVALVAKVVDETHVNLAVVLHTGDTISRTNVYMPADAEYNSGKPEVFMRSVCLDLIDPVEEQSEVSSGVDQPPTCTDGPSGDMASSAQTLPTWI